MEDSTATNRSSSKKSTHHSISLSKFFSRWHHNVLSLPEMKVNDMIAMKEKHISTIALSILTSSILCMSCSQQMEACPSLPDSVRTTIDSTREAMLATADTTFRFWFSNDVEFQSTDPHAYWLMNRMMHTVQNVRTAEDGIAWGLALNENVKEYSHRIDRRIYDEKAEDAAVRAIEDLIDIYAAGNQPELNAYSYVTSILEIYRTTNEYIRIMRFRHDEPLAGLLYKEYKAWFDLNNAASGIMSFHTYAAAGYSAMPMEINLTFAYWSEQRHKELLVEKDTFWKYHWEPFESDCRNVSQKRFLKLIRYFRSLTIDTIVKTNAKDWNLKKSEYAYARLDGNFDFDKISEMARLYEEAYCNWLTVREEIARLLPKEQGRSYREATKQMNTRLYTDLLELKNITY